MMGGKHVVVVVVSEVAARRLWDASEQLTGVAFTLRSTVAA